MYGMGPPTKATLTSIEPSLTSVYLTLTTICKGGIMAVNSVWLITAYYWSGIM